MPAITFACPKCKTILKSLKPVPAGKRVRCPTCSQIFEPPAETSPGSTPLPASVPHPRASEVRDRELVENEAPPPLRKPLRRPQRFDEADEHRADDLPAGQESERPRPKKRRKRKITGVGRLVKLYLILGAITLLLLIAGGGVAAWFYLNWDKNRGTGNEDPLAYVPPDSTLLVGLDVGTLMNHPALAAQVEKSFTANAANTSNWIKEVQKETGLAFKDLFDHTLSAFRPAAVPGRDFQNATVILKSKVAFDQNQMRKCCQNAVARKHKGKTYFEVSEGRFKTLFMPSNWMIIFTDVPEAQVEMLIDSNGTRPSLSADALGLAQQAMPSTAWGVARFDPTIRQAIQQAMAQAGPMLPANVPNLLNRAKGASLAGTWEGDAVHFQVSLACPDEPNAKQAAGGLQSLWDKQAKGQLALMTALAPPFISNFVKELTDSLQFSSQGSMAQASAQVRVAVLEALVKEAQKRPAAPPDFGLPGGVPGQPGGLRRLMP
jgi:hypothetical protein